MVTDRSGIALGILAADCAPVLLADTERAVIGAAHAGWKGAVGGVLESTVAAMEALGAKRETINAAIGPCITQPAYEVGPEFLGAFLQDSESNTRWFSPSERADHYHFDLPGYAAAQLAAIGVRSVETVARCTYAEADLFFSYRRTTHRGEADYGRQLSAIALTPV